MRTALRHSLSLVCVLLGSALAHARDSVLTAISSDALVFAVVHDLSDASQSVDQIAALVGAPAVDLLNLIKSNVGIEQGLDEQGDAALVLLGVDAGPQSVVLAPVADFAEFFSALGAEAPTAGVVEVQSGGETVLAGRKGDFAVFAPPPQREALERFLASTTTLASDAELAAWLDASKASIVVTRRGIEQLLPKVTQAIQAMQMQISAMAGENGKAAAAGLDMYVALFSAAETEVEQFCIGLRVDSAPTVDLVKRVQFKTEGSWSKWAAEIPSMEEKLFTGIPAEPFIIALGGVFPAGAMDRMMSFSAQMMQSQPQYNLSAKDAQRYADLSTDMMHGVRSMEMVMGTPEPGAGLYGRTLVLMTVDDSQKYLAKYDEALAKMSQLAEETKSPIFPVSTSRRVALGETEAVEVTMTMPDMSAIAPQGGPDMQAMMQHMFGAKGQLTISMAPVDEHAVLMSYASIDHLKSSLEFYRSQQPGLAAAPRLESVAAALPANPQFVAYVDLGGVANMVKQFMAAAPGVALIPQFPECPPIGIAAKITSSNVEGHLVITAETLKAIGETVGRVRAK